MKRGGEEIYVGPVGQNSSKLIEYFEVSTSKINYYRCMLGHLFPAKSRDLEFQFICSGN